MAEAVPADSHLVVDSSLQLENTGAFRVITLSRGLLRRLLLIKHIRELKITALIRKTTERYNYLTKCSNVFNVGYKTKRQIVYIKTITFDILCIYN